MADEKGAEPKKGGFFSRKKEEPKPVAQPAAPAKPGAPAAAPGKSPAPAQTAPGRQVAPPPGARPGAPAKPGAGPAKPAAPADLYEPRFSFDTVPEIEKRIDRMEVHKYAALQQLYESKYGEKLDVPTVFVSLDGELKESEKPVDQAKLAEMDAKIAATTGIPSKPGAPVTPGAPPVKPGAMPVKPGAAPVKPGAVRPPPGAVQARPVAGPVMTQVPAVPAKPSPINASTFWKYLWCYWRFPFRRLVKLGDNPTSGKLAGASVADAVAWVLLAIPRIGLCPIGFVLEKRKKGAGAAKNDTAAVAID